MNSRKAKELLPEVSLSTDLPLELLEDLVEFYWDDLRKAVTDMKDICVQIPHLGTYQIRGDRVLTKEIQKLQPLVNYYFNKPPKTPTRAARYMALTEKINKLTGLRAMYLECQQEREKIKSVRNEIRKTKEDLEGQGSNL